MILKFNFLLIEFVLGQFIHIYRYFDYNPSLCGSLAQHLLPSPLFSVLCVHYIRKPPVGVRDTLGFSSSVSEQLEGGRLQPTHHSRLSPWCRVRRAASGFWSWK